MSYRVVIPTAGTGSRLGKFTKHLNKSLVSITNRPTISHLIEQFPDDCEFVIALGYKGDLVRDFLELAYPNRTFFFEYVENFEGKGSGLGLSLLTCENYLQQPFVFLSCDTLVSEKIPEPKYNWMGYALINELSKYRTLKIENNQISDICEKGLIINNQYAYIGISGVNDYRNFWYAMHAGKRTAIEQGEAFGMKSILKTSIIYGNEFTWFDTGNLEALSKARIKYYEPNGPNILEKENEAIWFVGDKVIKYSNNLEFISNRVNRSIELNGFVPQIDSYRPNMYCYKKVSGEVLSEIITLPIFEDFLKRCTDFWSLKKLNTSENKQFKSKCMSFYKDKTFERIELFYNNFNKTDNAKFLNKEKVPQLNNLLFEINWDWISNGLAGRFHGDFHFENILYSEKDMSFTFLDLRQDFAGDLLIGDIYYDLAKLMHGLIINHGIITHERYSATWKGNEINFDFARKPILIECEKRFNCWIEENGYDLNKVRTLTGLIYLNIAALHHYPYSMLLYGLGKKMLNEELR